MIDTLVYTYVVVVVRMSLDIVKTVSKEKVYVRYSMFVLSVKQGKILFLSVIKIGPVVQNMTYKSNETRGIPRRKKERKSYVVVLVSFFLKWKIYYALSSIVS